MTCQGITILALLLLGAAIAVAVGTEIRHRSRRIRITPVRGGFS